MRIPLVALALVALVAGLRAEDEEESKPEPAAPPGDPVKLLSDLQAAIAAKDVAKVGALCKPIADVGKSGKSGEEIDALAEELSKGLGFKEADVRGEVLKALTELRSLKASGPLKKYIGRKVKGDREEELVGQAIDALGSAADPGEVDFIADMMKEQSIYIAKGACGAFKHYAKAKAKVRKQIAELVMKRMEGEKPSSGGQSGGKASAEQQKRWDALSPLLVGSMQALCRQPTIADVESWREWWKENKKKPWKDSDA